MKHVKRLMLSLMLVAGLPVLSPPGAVQAEQKSAVGPLSGGQVVSPQGGANAGYPNGIGDHYGQVIVNMEGDPFLGSGPVTFCYDIYVYGIAIPSAAGIPTAAHLHLGRIGQNGPIVTEFTPPISSGGGDAVSHGCTTVDSFDARGVMYDPTAAYVDVHTSNYPDGAQRAQLQ